MSVFAKELRGGFKAFCIWTGAIVAMMIVCIMMFPELRGSMNEVSNIFANMGGFTAAFGMDQLNFGELMGFYGIECGNILGIGAAFFAAYLGITILSKEEKEHTAEFLLSHPIRRSSVVLQKLLAVFVQLIVMNVLITGVSALSIAAIGETPDLPAFLLLHLAHLLLQLEIAGICFGVSAFLRGGGVGVGIGLAAMFYFLNIICNISDQGAWLKYITPFAYAEASDIIIDTQLKGALIALGMGYMAAGIAAGFLKYTKKDIAA